MLTGRGLGGNIKLGRREVEGEVEDGKSAGYVEECRIEGRRSEAGRVAMVDWVEERRVACGEG